MAVILTPVLLGLGSYSFSENSDGVFYAHSGSSSSMSPAPAEETSLGALPLPGHSIVEDYRAEMIVRNQQYNLKIIIMLLIISIISVALSKKKSDKASGNIKLSVRLLI